MANLKSAARKTFPFSSLFHFKTPNIDIKIYFTIPGQVSAFKIDFHWSINSSGCTRSHWVV